jgi:hypothetical protein
MSRNRRVLNDADFTGGLNLPADQFQLATNESPDMLNVDVDPRGGVRRRQAIVNVNPTAVRSFPTAMKAYYNSSGAAQVVISCQAGVTSGVFFGTGGDFNQIGANYTAAGPARFAVMLDNLYIARGTDGVPQRWNGSTVVGLTANSPTWQENIAAPTGGFLPSARLIAAHASHMFVAGTVESGVARPNRLRWSHPNRPEDWRSLDFVDVAIGDDGDVITALVPYRDHLLIFKNRSVHALYGYGTDSFQLVQVSREVGTISQESVVATEAGVFFCGWPDGLFVYEGGAVKFVGEKVMPAFQDGRVNRAAFGTITVGWLNRKVWLSVPWGTSTANSRTLVFDPSVSAWTMYGVGIGPSAELVTSATTRQVAAVAGTLRVCDVNVDADADDFSGNGSSPTLMPSHFTTGWYGRESIERRKRWRRPELLLRLTDAEYMVRVGVYLDFNDSELVRTFDLGTGGSGNALWGVALWNNALWAAASGSTIVARGSNIGRSRSVQLRFDGPAGRRWAFNALSIKYDPDDLR